MAKTLRVGLDLDGVFYPWLDLMRHRVALELNRPVDSFPEPTSWLFADEWGIDPTRLNELIEQGYADGIFIEADPDPQGLKLIHRLNDLGVEMHAVTHRPCSEQVLHDTYLWVAAFRLPFRSVTLTQAKDSVESDVFLDDAVHVYDALKEVGETVPVLFDTAQNQDHDGLRARGFDDFGDMIETVLDALENEDAEIDQFERHELIEEVLRATRDQY